MMKIGIIGSGEIGGSLARRLSKLGHQVSIANSRGPGSLADLAAETGAKAVTVHEAARSGDIVFVAIPAFKIADLPKDLFDEVDAEGGAHDRSINLALEACAFFEIPEAEAREMIRTMAQRVSDGWREAFRQVGVSGALARDYEGAFVGDEMETARSF